MDVQPGPGTAAPREDEGGPLPEVYAALVADTLALLDALRREGMDVVPAGTLPGLGEAPPRTDAAARPQPARLPPQAGSNPFAMPTRGAIAPPRPAATGGSAAPGLSATAAAARPTALPPRAPAPGVAGAGTALSNHAAARPAPTPAPPRAVAPPPIAPPPLAPPSAANDTRVLDEAAPRPGLFGGRWAALREDPADLIRAFYREIGDCRRCGHCDTRGRILHGEGRPDADVLILSGVPTGADDAAGRLFFGPAGEMLDRMLLNVLARERSDVHVASALLCAGDTVTVTELTACRPFLDRRLEVVRPRVILAMGAVAAAALGLPARHGWHRYGEREVYATFHPDELLADPGLKREAFEHLKQVRARIG